MDEKQVKSREILLGYLGGDKDKLERYLSKLAICHKPYDVADRVIRPIYVNEDISPDEVCKKIFYGSILDFAAAEYQKEIKAESVYHHIKEKLLPEWKKEREARIQQQATEQTKASVNKEKAATVVNIHLNITLHINGEKVFELLKQLSRKLYFTFTKNTESHFDGDGTAVVYQLCGTPSDMVAVLQSIGRELGETSIEKVSYLSKEHGIYLYNIPLSEAIKTAEDESRL